MGFFEQNEIGIGDLEDERSRWDNARSSQAITGFYSPNGDCLVDIRLAHAVVRETEADTQLVVVLLMVDGISL